MMNDFSTHFLGIRVFFSCIGCIGNVILIFSISHHHAKISGVKSFEVFLLGLAVSNLEEILIVNIYDIIILEDTSTLHDPWLCSLLKFLTLFGELCSILFTVAICIFRYQKVRHATEMVNLHIDSIMSASMVSGACVILSLSLSAPIFVINVPPSPGNSTRINCPLDFFQCHQLYCPIVNYIYKYVFIVVCNVLPMIIVTITSCLIIVVLLSQRKRVVPEVGVSASNHFGKKSTNLQRSTIAVLAAMGLFQVAWSLYLFVQLTFDGNDFAFWNEIKFFIATSYTSISPYVFGIGNNLFSLKSFTKK